MIFKQYEQGLFYNMLEDDDEVQEYTPSYCMECNAQEQEEEFDQYLRKEKENDEESDEENENEKNSEFVGRAVYKKTANKKADSLDFGIE